MRAPAIGERWETRRLLAILTAIAVVASMVGLYTGTARADHPGNTNSASYWAAHYQEHNAECFKHDPPNESTPHGFLSDGGLSVTLNPFNPAWPGDHWEALIVKAGGQDGGNAVYEHPDAGVAYFPPLNSGGQQPQVSHWIVCKGTTPPPTTSTTQPTTSTTQATTSTTQATTSTTQATTSTTQATTTTSIEDEVLPTVVTTAPEVDPDDELPFTGLDTDVMIGLSILFLGLGAVLLTLTRKLEEN